MAATLVAEFTPAAWHYFGLAILLVGLVLVRWITREGEEETEKEGGPDEGPPGGA